MSNQFFYVLGYGFFGQKAVQKIVRLYGNNAAVVVVDNENSEETPADNPLVQDYFREDAIKFLYSLAAGNTDHNCWVIPAVPQHVAFEYLLLSLRKDEKLEASRMPVPENLKLDIPFQLRGEQGTLYSSMASFRCPDNCAEPDEYCTATGLPRNSRLFELLQAINCENFYSLVLQSTQIAPGVGGFQLWELLNIKDNLVQACIEGREFFLISTSCKCHGVTDGMFARC